MNRAFDLRHTAWLAIVAAACAGLSAGPARADGDSGVSLPLLPAYATECGECHVAYPPVLLPPVSWQRIMDGLGKHYGVDASLDTAVRTDISRWLVQTSTRRSHTREAPPQDRISRTRWFLHEHDEVGADVWKRASVKSASNCGACHRNAAQGSYDEDSVRIPR